MNKILLILGLALAFPCYASRNIALLGAPGSGKGTTARELRARYGIPHISTGDMVSEQIRLGTPFGNKVAEMRARGQLLPDTPEFVGELMTMVIERLKQPDCKDGFILDGFPRTELQARELDRILKSLGKRLDAAVLLDVSRETVIRRLSNRLTCPACKMTYNTTTHAPKVQGQCDGCGTELGVRNDDRPEVVLNRLDSFEANIGPIVDFYSDLHQLVLLNGEGNSADEFAKLAAVLDQPYPRAYLQERIPKYPLADNPEIQKYNLIEMYKDENLIQYIVESLVAEVDRLNPDFIATPEARALPLFGAVLARTRKPGIFIRKSGQIPPAAPKISESYATAYSTDSLEMTLDPQLRGKTVLVIDDGLSSGGTLVATNQLLERAGMTVVHLYAIIRYHYRTPCEAFLSKGLDAITSTMFDLN